MMKQLVAVLFLGALLNITGTFSGRDVKAYFERVSGADGLVDATELVKTLTYMSRKELEGRDFRFSAATAVLLLESKEKYGFLNLEEFKNAIKTIYRYKKDFHTYDTDKSGTLSVNELASAPEFKDLSSFDLQELEKKFGRHEELPFDGYVEARADVQKAKDVAAKHLAGGVVSLTEDQFIEAAVLA